MSSDAAKEMKETLNSGQEVVYLQFCARHSRNPDFCLNEDACRLRFMRLLKILWDIALETKDLMSVCALLGDEVVRAENLAANLRKAEKEAEMTQRTLAGIGALLRLASDSTKWQQQQQSRHCQR